MATYLSILEEVIYLPTCLRGDGNPPTCLAGDGHLYRSIHPARKMDSTKDFLGGLSYYLRRLGRLVARQVIVVGSLSYYLCGLGRFIARQVVGYCR